MADSQEHQYVQKMIADHPVMVFSKSTCPYCAMAKEVLNEVGVEYTVEEIDGRKDGNELQNVFMQITGARTVPRVFIGGKCIGGGSDTQALQKQGKLVPLLREAGATFKNATS